MDAPRSFDDLAAAMYSAPKADAALLPVASPAPAPAAPTADQVAPSSFADLAERMYAPPPPPPKLEVPAHITELRQAGRTAADDLYEPAPFVQFEQVLANDETFAPAERKAIALEMTHMAKDVGLDHQDVAELMARLQSVRDLTPEQTQANHASAMDLLRAEFGDGADNALQAARSLAQRDPRVATVLATSRLGDDPQTILRFARLAVQQRGAGRLK